MDIEKLIEQYRQATDKWEKRHPVTDTFDLRVQDVLRDAATALSTLQAENEKLKRALAEMKRKPWSWRRKSLGHGESACRSICGAVRRRRTDMENNKKLTLKVYRHKEEKDVFLLRVWEIREGDENTEFYIATTDIIMAIKNVYAENSTKEPFENWMGRFNGKLHVWFTKKLEVEIDGYTGTLEKTVKLYVRDFEKVLLTED